MVNNLRRDSKQPCAVWCRAVHGEGDEQQLQEKGGKGRNRFPIAGAGDGNRTHVISLEGWSSTIELHPRVER